MLNQNKKEREQANRWIKKNTWKKNKTKQNIIRRTHYRFHVILSRAISMMPMSNIYIYIAYLVIGLMKIREVVSCVRYWFSYTVFFCSFFRSFSVFLVGFGEVIGSWLAFLFGWYAMFDHPFGQFICGILHEYFIFFDWILASLKYTLSLFLSLSVWLSLSFPYTLHIFRLCSPYIAR